MTLGTNGLGGTLPTPLGYLTGLTDLDLQGNQLRGVPVEFQTLSPIGCNLEDNPGFSCANVGLGTDCCVADNCGGDTSTCYVPECSFTDLTCVTGARCPGGTTVYAPCRDPFGAGNPCACTALKDLAVMNAAIFASSPWNDLLNQDYW